MLKVAGLKSNLTWIGTRTIPYSYLELPTPIVDNHMILSYQENDKTYFLDATGRYLPLEMPSSFIQGKEALIGDGEGKFKIETVPIVSAETNSYIQNTNLSINANKLLGKGETALSGYYKIDFYNQLEGKNSEKELIEYYTNKLRKGSNKFLIESYEEQNKFSYDEDLRINYEFNINDYSKLLGDEIYINLNLKREATHFRSENDRENDIEVTYKSYYIFENTLDIPEGYRVDYIPENFELNNNYINCNISYQQKKDKVVYKHILKMDFLSLSPEEQKKVNASIKKIEKQYKETVVFKKLN